MAPASQRAGRAQGVALRVLAVAVGLFFLFNGLTKIAWLWNDGILAARLDGWLQGATPYPTWFIETIAGPGAPMFARLVPIAELSAGFAFILGIWIRPAAICGLVMVATFHFARGLFQDPEALTDGLVFPVIGALIALAIGGSGLPLSLRR